MAGMAMASGHGAALMDDQACSRLAQWLGQALGTAVSVAAASRLSGGAIQENWQVEALVGGAPRVLVIRKDAAATIDASHSRADEFALIRLAHAAGMLVPEPVAFCTDPSVLGSPFAVLAKVSGVGFGPRIVKDLALGGDRERLAMRLGAELARIHALVPSAGMGLDVLGQRPSDPLAADIAGLRQALDRLGTARPALEWGLRWAECQPPKRREVTLVHRDFRTGNYMVDGEGLTAILDWEFAGWGDPMSDVGWFCAACWRFGRLDLEAGGIGSRAAFYRGYEQVGGRRVDPEAVVVWEVMAHIRWAVIALQQGARHSSGREFSLEHALTGRIAAELERAVLRMTTPATTRHRSSS
jgi:aminoglycoside phosphotransferase (APT) family kinase protein